MTFWWFHFLYLFLRLFYFKLFILSQAEQSHQTYKLFCWLHVKTLKVSGIKLTFKRFFFTSKAQNSNLQRNLKPRENFRLIHPQNISESRLKKLFSELLCYPLSLHKKAPIIFNPRQYQFSTNLDIHEAKRFEEGNFQRQHEYFNPSKLGSIQIDHTHFYDKKNLVKAFEHNVFNKDGET